MGSGERCKLPKWGPERSTGPAEKAFLAYFEPRKRVWWKRFSDEYIVSKYHVHQNLNITDRVLYSSSYNTNVKTTTFFNQILVQSVLQGQCLRSQLTSPVQRQLSAKLPVDLRSSLL